MLKNIFSNNKVKEFIPDSPGRTFKRIDTGSYFGCEKSVIDEERIQKSKQKKIKQILELGLKPKFIRYRHKNSSEKLEIKSACLVFQKEELAKKWNMIHVVEISFILNAEDFSEFEEMSGFILSKDFTDLTLNDGFSLYEGAERRKETREELLFPDIF